MLRVFDHDCHDDYDHRARYSLLSLMQTLDEWGSNILVTDPMRVYRAKRDAARKRVTDKYSILGFISSGTYGRVYKAQSKASDGRIHAIKKFKPDKEGDVVTYTGISQSAIREIAVRTVLSNAMSSD